jgi:hypothetical protein
LIEKVEDVSIPEIVSELQTKFNAEIGGHYNIPFHF